MNIIKFNNFLVSVRKEFVIFIGEYRFYYDKMLEDFKKWLRKLKLFLLFNVYVFLSFYVVENVVGIVLYYMKEFLVRYNVLLFDRDFKGIFFVCELGC